MRSMQKPKPSETNKMVVELALISTLTSLWMFIFRRFSNHFLSTMLLKTYKIMFCNLQCITHVI